MNSPFHSHYSRRSGTSCKRSLEFRTYAVRFQVRSKCHFPLAVIVRRTPSHVRICVACSTLYSRQSEDFPAAISSIVAAYSPRPSLRLYTVVRLPAGHEAGCCVATGYEGDHGDEDPRFHLRNLVFELLEEEDEQRVTARHKCRRVDDAEGEGNPEVIISLQSLCAASDDDACYLH